MKAKVENQEVRLGVRVVQTKPLAAVFESFQKPSRNRGSRLLAQQLDTDCLQYLAHEDSQTRLRQLQVCLVWKHQSCFVGEVRLAPKLKS